MAQIDQITPMNDPDQFVIEPVSKDKQYLGNASVVHAFVGHFANDVMRAYDGFLAGRTPGDEAQRHINSLVHEYGESFMGNDPRYEIAPWQGVRLRKSVMYLVPNYDCNIDCGEQLFKFLALQCVKCSIGLAKGFPADEVGENLRKCLDHHRALILGVHG